MAAACLNLSARQPRDFIEYEKRSSEPIRRSRRFMRILCAFGRHAYGDPARGESYEHANFLPALKTLGHTTSLFDPWDRTVYADFAQLNRAFVDSVERFQPDVIFCVLMGYEIWSETLDLVRRNANATVINWGTDDSWKYSQFARFLAPHVDCYATTSQDAFEQAQRDGLSNFVLSQWAAADSALAEPLPARQCPHRVTFVGAAYGNRRRWIEQLARRGIIVQTFGHGWPTGPVDSTQVRQIMRHSIISLNFGDSGWHVHGIRPYRSRQIKARIFEVPGAGGFLLTQPAAHLEQYYRVGQEVDTFDTVDELAEKIDHYLRNHDLRDRIAAAGYERTCAEHTYSARFRLLLREAEVLSNPRRSGVTLEGVSDSEQEFLKLRAMHQPSSGVRVLKLILLSIARMAFGTERSGRAVRRLVFELSWRMAREHTYSASGWPGRMFYKDS